MKGHSDCRSFITVCQSYTVKELLEDMIQKLCKDADDESLPKGLHEMNDISYKSETIPSSVEEVFGIV